MANKSNVNSNDAAAAPLGWRTCAGAALVTAVIVVFLFWRKGLLVILSVLTYLLALTTMKGVVKLVEHKCFFKFPLFLTATHFASGAVIAFAILLRDTYLSGEKLSTPTAQVLVSRFGPLAAVNAVSIAMGNFALIYSTTAFVEIVSASGPLITLLISFIMKQPVELALVGPCLLVFVGCALTSNGDPHFSWLGLALCAGANILRSLKSICQQMLLQADGVSFSPLEVLAWTSIPGFLIMMSCSMMQEGVAPLLQWYHEGLFTILTGTVLLSCINATILNLAVLYVVKDLGAVGTQVVAQSKSILVVLGGVCFLHEQFSALESLGFMLVLIGVYSYNSVDANLKAKKKADQLNDEKSSLLFIKK
jgi:drug/metabolite transporter (DMT)-like permease